ncbi:MAG: two-component system chemotaxis sensor kinase CheA [Bacteriovoracaceae bacterium]|jgi:two-component system chemotaxis sensor kinase CheA
MNNRELKNVFLVESFEHLTSIREDLTQIEKDPTNKELLNKLYRTVHTIKGSVSFLGYRKLQDITHSAENLLDELRENNFSINSDIVDALLDTFDLFNLILKGIEKNDIEGNINIDSIRKRLDNLLANKGQLLKLSIAENKNNEQNMREENSHEGHERSLDFYSSACAPDAISVDKVPGANSVVKVNVKDLDKIMNIVGELVITRNEIVQYANSRQVQELTTLSQELNSLTSELQTEVMKSRMQPIGIILTHFERAVRDFSRENNKNINLLLSGLETELDKTLVESIKDSLGHIIRNACDHGIETIEERKIKNKSDQGIISIKAYNESGQVVIEIVDDGRGLDRHKIGKMAIKKSLITKNQFDEMTDIQVYNLVFTPGLSTAKKITNVSGRGVGMDVVKTNIEKIGGSVIVNSELGIGSTFKLRIPQTLAMVSALITKNNNEYHTVKLGRTC